MRILFGMRSDYLTNRGGDTFQMLKTKEYLEKYNDMDIQIISSPEEISMGVDVLHVFNMQTTHLTYSLIERAKKLNVKVVLSPIVWRFGDASYVNKVMRITHNFKLMCQLHSLAYLFEIYSVRHESKIKKEILEMSDVVAPNSIEEMNILKEQYGVNFLGEVVPNCIDPQIARRLKEKERKSIIQVGRIEPTKNQMAVLLAMMKHKEIPLYFIGKQNKRKSYYTEELKKLALKRGNTYFIEELPQEELVSYYETAKVHVLPSFRESPGLVTLEALFYGCNIVTSSERYCPVKFYKLDRYGTSCDPYLIDSVEKAILNEYRKKSPVIPPEYFETISYENAARITRNIYLELKNNSTKENALG